MEQLIISWCIRFKWYKGFNFKTCTFWLRIDSKSPPIDLNTLVSLKFNLRASVHAHAHFELDRQKKKLTSTLASVEFICEGLFRVPCVQSFIIKMVPTKCKISLLAIKEALLRGQQHGSSDRFPGQQGSMAATPTVTVSSIWDWCSAAGGNALVYAWDALFSAHF